MVDGNLSGFLAEHGLLPMYGMPTRVRDLYVGIEENELGQPDWDSIDREMDLAIYEFAPGSSLPRSPPGTDPAGLLFVGVALNRTPNRRDRGRVADRPEP